MAGNMDPPRERGVIPRSFDQIFNDINATPNVQFMVRCSMLEIYNEMVKDLTQKGDVKLEVKQDPKSGVYVKDLTHNEVKNEEECMK